MRSELQAAAFSTNMMSERHVQVLILGAGIAGLSAAEHLQRNEFRNWKILEANDRCGGRMKTTNFGSSFVEEGANWIHGACPSNSSFLFASQHGLITSPLALFTREDGLYFRTDGSLVNTSLTKKTYDFFKTVEKNTAKLKPDNQVTLQDFMKSNFEVFKKELEQEKDVNSLLNHFLNYVNMHGGDDAELMSARGYGMYEELPGGDLRLTKGYKPLITALLSKLPPDQVVLNHAVVDIKWDCSPIIIKCANRTAFTADMVLVTLPLGVLKHNQMFSPSLPPEKIEIIGRTGFGRVCKIFLEYRNPFWQPELLGIINLAWSDEDIENYKGCSDFWVTKLLAFEEIPFNRNVLYSWLGGAFAEVVETIPPEHLKRVLTDVLRKFLGNPTIPAPDGILVTNWCHDSWTRGSYSYRSMKSQEGDFEKLGEPVSCEEQVKILFAGEATHPRFFSTVHGARSSGIREAERILKGNSRKLEK